jgi:hypothetical protein
MPSTNGDKKFHFRKRSGSADNNEPGRSRAHEVRFRETKLLNKRVGLGQKKSADFFARGFGGLPPTSCIMSTLCLACHGRNAREKAIWRFVIFG